MLERNKRVSNPCKELGCIACCGNIQMDLSSNEAASLVAKGARLTLVGDGNPFDLMEGHLLMTYYLQGECPNLVDGECSVIGTRDRPSVCGQFQFNGKGCKSLRGVR